MSSRNQHPQTGAALLAALVTVALVASLASAALWLQWRQVAVETADRGRSQTQWLMTGALDWTRLILAEDARTAQHIDHLGEPWALPVQESKLSTFLSQDRQWREGDPEVYLSGRIIDAQSRLNLSAMVSGGRLSTTVVAQWVRLFELLNLPLSELDLLARQWQAASLATTSPPSITSPLLPQRIEQLTWLGISRTTVETLRPYTTILPVATPVNLNTASALVLQAVVPGLGASQAQAFTRERDVQPWSNLRDIKLPLDSAFHDVKSRYFEVHGRLRMDQVTQDEVALLERRNGQVLMLWRVSSHQQASTLIKAPVSLK